MIFLALHRYDPPQRREHENHHCMAPPDPKAKADFDCMLEL